MPQHLLWQQPLSLASSSTGRIFRTRQAASPSDEVSLAVCILHEAACTPMARLLVYGEYVALVDDQTAPTMQ